MTDNFGTERWHGWQLLAGWAILYAAGLLLLWGVWLAGWWAYLAIT